MPIKCYELLHRNLHVVDNHTRTATLGTLFKVKPSRDAIRSYLRLEQEQDEQIFSAKTERSGIRQYLPKKIHKWGFKNFVKASELGITYNFFIYSGTNTRGGAQCSCEDIVLNTFLHIKISAFSLITGFRTYPSFKRNKEGLLATATSQLNRSSQCLLTAEKELKQQGRGIFEYRTDHNFGFHFVNGTTTSVF